MLLNVSFFQHNRDATPRVGTLDFPSQLDDFRDADARVLRDFLDYDYHGAKPPTPTKNPGKNGPLWSPALFNGRRNKASVVTVCALVLDYDHLPGGGEFDPAEVMEKWARYTHVLHSTYTPGRYRMVLPYPAPITPADHDRMYAWALRQDARLDGSVADASRAFYWPTYRADLDVEPVFGYNRGELLDPASLDLPSERVRVSGSPSLRIQSAPVYSAGESATAGEQRSGGAVDSPYAGIDAVEQREDLALIETRCLFMAHARRDAATLPEPEWYAALSIIARCRGGDALAHEVSSPYPGYDPDACEEKYQRAKTVGPATCAHVRTISQACRACPLQITSPVLLGRVAEARRYDAPNTRSEDRPDGLHTEGETNTRGAPPLRTEDAGENPAGDTPDYFAAIRDAEARYQQARLAEDQATVAVEAARRRASLVRTDKTASEQDIADAVTALGQAREAHRQAERVRKAKEKDLAAAKKRVAVDGLPPGADPAVWQRLRMNREGTPLNNMANLLAILEGDPRWSSRLTYDAFSLDVCLDGAPLPEEEATRLTGKIGSDYHFDTSTNALLEGVRAVAMARRFHPVQDWLGGLRWDGTERVRDLMLRGFGALPRFDEELVRLIGARFLVSLVARALKPGAKVDTMLVLTGKQGMFKSTSYETLVGRRWFADTRMDLANKDSFINLQGKWLIEFGEMSAVRRSDDNTSKGWITSRVDRFRAPYAKRAEDHPRGAVACGTANGEDYDFLQDPTGYRRYWPLTVSKADLGWIEDNREQLFAEAVVMHGAGFRWWFDEDTEETARLKKFVAPYVPTHPWTEEVARWLQATVDDRNLEVFSILTVLQRAMGMAVVDVDKKHETTVGNILNAIGCERIDRDVENGILTTRYRRPARMLANREKGRVVALPGNNPQGGQARA